MSVMVFEGMEEEEEEEIEVEEDASGGYVKEEEKEHGGEGKEKEMAGIMERLKRREKKEKAADLVSKLRGKKKANKKIMPYEIYATSGE
ncbi:MAG: hypothetical protein GH149_02960 [Methanosarcinales archaeon]|nr:hypothetical protein [Methanosarcinales archaeon]